MSTSDNPATWPVLGSGRLRLRHIQCFLAVARFKRLRAAAEALSITQPAVTKTLNELEDIVGAQLLQRGRRGVVLTAAGEAFQRHANRSLEALDQALASVRETPERQWLRVGALPTVAPALLGPALVSWRAAHPRVTLHLVEGTNAQLIRQLSRHELDLALARLSDPQDMPGITFEFLYAEPLVAVVRAGHPLVGRQPLTANDLRRFELVLPPSGTLIRHGAEGFLATQGDSSPSVMLETLSVSVARIVLAHSNAVWLTTPSAVTPDLRDGSLIALGLASSGTEEPVGLLQRSDAEASVALRALLVALRKAAAARATGWLATPLSPEG